MQPISRRGRTLALFSVLSFAWPLGRALGDTGEGVAKDKEALLPAPASSASSSSSPEAQPSLLPQLPPPAAPEPPAVVVPAPSACAAPVVPPPPSFARFTLAIGATVMLSPGGIGPMGDVSLAASWHPVRAWSIGVFGQVPTLTADVVGSGETDQVGATLVGAEVAHVLGLESWRLHPEVGLGAAAASLHLSGSAASASAPPPSADLWMAAAVARFGLNFALASEWRLRADATLAFAFPDAAVDFSGVRAATWGRPLGTLGASLEFVLR